MLLDYTSSKLFLLLAIFTFCGKGLAEWLAEQRAMPLAKVWMNTIAENIAQFFKQMMPSFFVGLAIVMMLFGYKQQGIELAKIALYSFALGEIAANPFPLKQAKLSKLYYPALGLVIIGSLL